jgi:hypothetical protein
MISAISGPVRVIQNLGHRAQEGPATALRRGRSVTMTAWLWRRTKRIRRRTVTGVRARTYRRPPAAAKQAAPLKTVAISRHARCALGPVARRVALRATLTMIP